MSAAAATGNDGDGVDGGDGEDGGDDDGGGGCIPGSPGESGLVSRGSQGLRSPLESPDS